MGIFFSEAKQIWPKCFRLNIAFVLDFPNKSILNFILQSIEKSNNQITQADVFVGLCEHTTSQKTIAGSSPWRPGDIHGDPRGKSGTDESDPGGDESDSRPDREVRAVLQGSELWKRFYEIGTEMIITKAGRYNIIMGTHRDLRWMSLRLNQLRNVP